MAVTAEARSGACASPRGPGAAEYRSTALMSGLRMSGKMLGLVKTLVIAATFGASASLDAFWIAFSIPMILPGLIRGVVATAFIPGFMRSSLRGGKDVDWRGLNTLITLVVLVIAVFCALVIVFRDPLVSFMAPGLNAPTHVLASELTALMSLGVLFFGINAIFSAILQALHRFVIMSLESVITNIVTIAGCVTLAQVYGVQGLVVSVIAGFAVHTMMLAWANRDLVRRHIRPAVAWRHADFVQPARHMFPLLVGYVGAVAMSFVDRMFVSLLDAGMISVLAYAGMIAMLPMEVFGQAVMTAFYPSLSRDVADGNGERLRATHIRGVRLLLFVLVPTTAGLVLVAHPLVSLLLERGQFSASAAEATALTLAALALGLPGRAVNYFNFRVFHARQQPWIPVFIGIFGVLLNAGLDWLLIDSYGVVGIAFATSASLTVAALLSSVLLQHRLQSPVLAPLFSPLARLLLMTAVLCAVTLVATPLLAGLVPHGRWLDLLPPLLALVPGCAAFVLVGLFVKLDEVRMLWSVVRRGRRGLSGGFE